MAIRKRITKRWLCALKRSTTFTLERTPPEKQKELLELKTKLEAK